MPINNNSLINSRNIRFSNTKTCLEIDKNNELKEDTYYFTQKLKSATNKFWQYFGYNSITENNLETILKHTFSQLEQITNKNQLLTNEQLSETTVEIENILKDEHFKHFLNSNRGVNAQKYLENIQSKLEEIHLQDICNRINVLLTDQKLLEINLEIQNIKPKGKTAKILLDNIHLKLGKMPNNKAIKEFIIKESTTIQYNLLNITKLNLNLDNYPLLKEKFENIKQRTNEINEANNKMLYKSIELIESYYKVNDNLIENIINEQEKKIKSRVFKRKADKPKSETFHKSIELMKNNDNLIEDKIKELMNKFLIISKSNSTHAKSIEKQKSYNSLLEQTLKKEFCKKTLKGFPEIYSPHLNSSDQSFNSDKPIERKLSFF